MTTTQRSGPDIGDLDRIAGSVNSALRAARVAEHLATSTDAAEVATAHTFARSAGDAAASALSDLCRMGATVPGLPHSSKPIPLDKLDTPHVRELLAAMEAALPLAGRIDADRGRAMPVGQELSPGEPRGVDLADAVYEIVQRLRIEVHGPGGRD